MLVDIKVTLGVKFGILAHFPNLKVLKWLTDFKIDNVESNLLWKYQVNIVCAIQDNLFTLKVKDEIIMATLQDYFKSWVEEAIIVVAKS